MLRQIKNEKPERIESLAARGYALLEAQSLREAEDSFNSILTEFPDKPHGYQGLAFVAQRRWQWKTAIACWEKCIALGNGDGHIRATVEMAQCLFEVGEVTRAAALLEAISDHVEGFSARCRLSALLDPPETVKRRWDECIARFPESPVGMRGKAEVLFSRQEFDSLEALLIDLLAKWPKVIAAEILAAKNATAAKHWEMAGERWKALLRKCPGDDEVIRGYVRYLAATNQAQAVDAFLSTLKDKTKAADARLEYCLASDDYGGAMMEATLLAKLKGDDPAFRLRHSTILMREGSPEALHAAHWILQDLYRDCSGSIAVAIHLAKALIRAGSQHEAQAIIQSLPADDQRLEVETLRAWDSHIGNDDPGAKERWKAILDRQYVQAVHATIHDLERLDDHSFDMRPDDILLFSVMRNECARVDWFLTYYRKLGVNKFIIVDNASSDGTDKLLLKSADVILYRTTDQYGLAGAGMRWINELIARHGRNNWCLHVDSDEAFVFPGDTTLGLRGLTGYLRWSGQEALFATMLDMYPPQPTRNTTQEDIQSLENSYNYFDADLHFYGHEMCPYREGFGGVRRRLFGGYQLINKVPLINGAAGIKFLLSSHRTTPAKLSDVTGVILHYHLINLLQPEFRPLLDEAIERRQFPSNALERLRSRNQLPKVLSSNSLVYDKSVQHHSEDQLLELGIVQAPKTYLEFSRAAGIAHATLESL